MTIADDPQNPKQAKKLGKSLDAIAALRVAMEKRLAEAQIEEEARAKNPAPAVKPVPEKQFITETAQPVTTDKKAGHSNKDKGRKEEKTIDPIEWPVTFFRIAERSQKLIQEYIERNKGKPFPTPAFDSAHLFGAFRQLTQKVLSDPQHFVDAQINLWQGYIKIWQSALARAQGQDADPVIKPLSTDKRFQDNEWQSNWLFDYIKQSYLLTAQWVHQFVHQQAQQFDPKLARKLEFYTRQMVDAISPSNFWLTNPEVLRTTFETGGENLVKGLENLLGDLERGNGQLRISMSDLAAFEVGKNLATTPGEVVYQNDLMQLIQYTPKTEKVHSVPLLIMPPWINKFYILDLRENNSYIGYLVAQGYTVFCISWVNPDQRHANKHFDDYMSGGSLAAMSEIRRITREDKINIVGYCIGGTLLASTLAYLNAVPDKPENMPQVASATYLVTLVDFSEPGDLGVFIDDEQVTSLEHHMKEQGYLEATAMATSFNLLRANDLIWSFVVNNYLLGKEPFPFDILYWNGDSTNLPCAMQSFYLRKMYIENKLIEPNGLTMKNVPIDLHSIMTPSFMLSTREDHIAPWRSTYAATQIYKGPVTFMLSGSGHIAGVINAPVAKKYGYWTNADLPANPEEWLEKADYHPGSWWPAWLKWLEPYAGEQVPARAIESGIEAAPGSYVRVKAV